MKAAFGLIIITMGYVAIAGGWMWCGNLDVAAEAAAGPIEPATLSTVANRELLIAGSGSNLALTQLLARAFEQTQSNVHVRVHPSIGSRGGVHAAHDRAVHIGLLSRDLTTAETALGLQVVPYARVPVVLACSSDVLKRNMNAQEIVALYRGVAPPWKTGVPVTVLLREHGDSSTRAAGKIIHGLQDALDAAQRARLWRVLRTDRQMQEALRTTSGAVGFFDLGTLQIRGLPLRALSIDGVQPSAATVRDGRYPLFKDLSFVVPQEASDLARQFIAFTRGLEGRSVMEQAGYIALPEVP